MEFHYRIQSKLSSDTEYKKHLDRGYEDHKKKWMTSNSVKRFAEYLAGNFMSTKKTERACRELREGYERLFEVLSNNQTLKNEADNVFQTQFKVGQDPEALDFFETKVRRKVVSAMTSSSASNANNPHQFFNAQQRLPLNGEAEPAVAADSKLSHL